MDLFRRTRGLGFRSSPGSTPKAYDMSKPPEKPSSTRDIHSPSYGILIPKPKTPKQP